MTRLLSPASRRTAAAGLLVFLVGCSEQPNSGPVAATAPAMPPGSPGGPMGPGGGPPSPIKQIMGKVAKGPNALTPTLGRELNEAEPPWDAIQPQAKEFAEQANLLAAAEPPRGSKESWSKLTADYVAAATDLDKAAQAKDRDAALAAHSVLAGSCKSCHNEHKPGPGGGMMGGPGGRMGGPGGPGGFGGPPPGGPGGPPPGGIQ